MGLTKSDCYLRSEPPLGGFRGSRSRAFCHRRCVFLLALAAMSLATTPSLHGQLTTQAEPTVGNSTGTQLTTSPIFLDATQFHASDMCASIADACASTSPIPGGTTIDARGFTGNQVCKATTVTIMLSKCTTNGGKLLLGLVNLYADGPASGNYTDGNGSGIGTPAFILPSKFWGIEGVSRGAGDAGSTLGTFLSVCTGSNAPVGLGGLSPAPGSPSCTTGFPQRKYGIGSTGVSGTNPTIMTINISPAVTAYVGELAMVKGGVTGENGMYAIQSVTLIGGSSVQIGVVVPPGTPTCSTGCGNLILGTPILGFAPPSGNAYGTVYNGCGPSHNLLCSSFGEHIKNLGFNCQGTSSMGALEGCIGWQNLYAQEESGADTFIVTNFNFAGVDTHSLGAQNFGPILNAEVYTGTGNTACAGGTTGIYIGDAEMRGLNGWTINNAAESGGGPGCSSPEPAAGVLMDAMNTEVRNGHCEGFDNCVLIGANSGSASGVHVSGISGGHSGNAGTNVVQISANNKTTNGNYVIERIRKNAHTNGIADNINGVTLMDNFIAQYSYGGVRAGAIRSGVSTPTDIAGRLTLSGGSATQSLTASYSSAPNCGCWDITHVSNTCSVSESTTQLTFTGTGTDTIKYICIGRN